MKIAVNTRLLIKNKLEGIAWFTLETLKCITKKYSEHQFYFLFDRKFDEEFIFSENITPVIISPQTRHPFLWYIWFEKRLPKILKKINPDVFVSPDGYIPLNIPFPSLSVIHDINFVHRPEDLPFLVSKYYNYYFPLFAKKSKRIATVSEYSKNDIAKEFKINKEKIDVVYNGCNILYKKISPELKEKTKEKFSCGKNYFIFIGAMHPRKNVKNLIIAFDEFKKSYNSDFKLLIVGNKMFKNKDLEKSFKKLFFKKDIIFTGRLSINDLKLVLASAFALTFTPFFEGFGIPILEAMYCDVPVISSNLTSIPEVCGNAGILVNPHSVEEIKNAMIKIVKDENLRNKLIKNAQIQRKKFSWEKTSDKLWNSIEKLK